MYILGGNIVVGIVMSCRRRLFSLEDFAALEAVVEIEGRQWPLWPGG